MPHDLPLFVVGVLVSLGASFALVTRLERLGQRLGAPEAMLGLAIALAADSPEISTAIVALARGQNDVGVGVVLGSNIFNLAALLGLSAVVAGHIVVHRKVVLFEGLVAIGVASVAVVVIAGLATPILGLALALALLVRRGSLRPIPVRASQAATAKRLAGVAGDCR